MKISTTTAIHTHLSLYVLRYTVCSKFEEYLEVHTKIRVGIKINKTTEQMKSSQKPRVKRVAQISTELSGGTIFILHHQQQRQRKTTATRTRVSTQINR